MLRQPRTPDRGGFTIVELLVSMALIIFIMYVLAEAFSAGSRAFRDLKAIGDMNARLRSATSTLRRYLSMDHFEGRKRLSDPGFWNEGPPKEGFFRLWQDDDGVDEGPDLDGNRSLRTTTHHLHFAVRYRGNQRGNFFQTSMPSTSPLLNLPTPDSRFGGGTTYTSSWSEVAIYLRPDPSGETTTDPNAASGASPLPLHTLHLRQRLLVSSHDDVAAAANGTFVMPGLSNYAQYSEASITRNPPDDRNTTSIFFNNPGDVTMPIRRFGFRFWQAAPAIPAPAPELPDLPGNRSPRNYPTLGEEDSNLGGSDVLLTDVISMDIRVLLGKEAYGAGAEQFVSLFGSQLNSYVMTRPALGTNARVFDTWSSRKDDRYDYSKWAQSNLPETIPIYTNAANTRPIGIRAIQITLRIWDTRTKQSRQVSIVQDL